MEERIHESYTARLDTLSTELKIDDVYRDVHPAGTAYSRAVHGARMMCEDSGTQLLFAPKPRELVPQPVGAVGTVYIDETDPSNVVLVDANGYENVYSRTEARNVIEGYAHTGLGYVDVVEYKGTSFRTVRYTDLRALMDHLTI